jgi:hypothetical protein
VSLRDAKEAVIANTVFACPSCGWHIAGLLDCIAAAFGMDEALRHVGLVDGMLVCQRPDGSCTARWSIAKHKEIDRSSAVTTTIAAALPPEENP